MAGDWIKVEAGTPDKPEVLLMAELLTLSPDEVFGKLFKVWRWFDAQSQDGHAGGVTDVTLMKFIDGLVQRQGFAACMKKVGWLTDSGVPNFDYHMGESAKNRALAQKRKAKERSLKSHANTVTREEKRREEVKQHRVVNDTTSFSTFWEAWPKSQRKVAKAKCEKLWERENLDSLASQILPHVAASKESKSWQEGFDPLPYTYLTQRRWEAGLPGGGSTLPSYT